MRVIIEQIDHDIYMDVILDPKDLSAIQDGEFVECDGILRKTKVYILTALKGFADHEEERERKKEDQKGHGRIQRGETTQRVKRRAYC